MNYLLDELPLNGAHATRITFRPRRIARPIRSNDLSEFFDRARYECQVWGGANAPFVPVSSEGEIDTTYAQMIAGSAIDGMDGLEHNALFHPLHKVELASPREPEREYDEWGRQLAAALLPYRRQDQYAAVSVASLALNDPWAGIYAACLGLLPTLPNPNLLNHCRLREDLTFEDFVNINRAPATGSLEDLLTRLMDGAQMSPRQMSMLHLAYGGRRSANIRHESSVLPDDDFARYDAGPNVVVVCSPGDVSDLCLLWNLRAAHGDFGLLPIGVPIDQMTSEALETLVHHPNLDRNGISDYSLYVTSSSVSEEQLEELVPNRGKLRVAIRSLDQLLSFGPAAGWTRDEVIAWHDGQANLLPFRPADHKDVFEQGALATHVRMQVDVRVASDPFPNGKDLRVDAMNFAFYYGAASMAISAGRSEPIKVSWPSRQLAARAVASQKGLTLSESEPGRASRILIAGLDSIWDLTNIAHAPLLTLLEETAARSGFGWYKQRMRLAGKTADPAEAIGPTVDELPERSFNDFKKVLGNSDKAARYWLSWAEQSGLLVKGFSLQCGICRAKQWIPVAAFAPPIICRGCARIMESPFGDRPSINFMYRLSERLRRVYEQDSMGHLLTLRFFNAIFSSGNGSMLVGAHPGMEVCQVGCDQVEGEADVILLSRDANFLPIEVKRSPEGLTSDEIGKLDHLAEKLGSPWTGVVACGYGHEFPPDFRSLERRTIGVTPFRIILSYDALLELHPAWVMERDPFAFNPLEPNAIIEREKAFVRYLQRQADDGPFDRLTPWMLKRPPLPSVQNDAVK